MSYLRICLGTRLSRLQFSWSSSIALQTVSRFTFVCLSLTLSEKPSDLSLISLLLVVLVNMIIAIIVGNFEGENEESKHEQQILDYAAIRGGYGYFMDNKQHVIFHLRGYLTTPIGVRKKLARRFLLENNELFDKPEKETLPERHKGNSEFARHNNRLSQAEADGLRNRSLFIFGPHNKFKRFLQQIVTPGGGFRKDGVEENVIWSRLFNGFITLAVLASVIVTVITTPEWRYRHRLSDSQQRSVIVDVTDNVFTAIFTVEFLIRVIADGFIFTPDAYLRNHGNQMDFFVLLTMYALLAEKCTNQLKISRFFGYLRAMRTLRLVRKSSISRIYRIILFDGFNHLTDAICLYLASLVPFAIYGKQLYSGLFLGCNDSDGIHGVDDCVGTFRDPESNLTIPRVWSNPHGYSFDTLGDSFLVLVGIISQEGRSTVQKASRNIVGLGLQPSKDASVYNGIFFALFNLLGGYFVMSLFLATVTKHYSKRTGTLYMSGEQLQWMMVERLLMGVRMSRMRQEQPSNSIRALCFQIVSPKSKFAILVTIVTIFNGIVLIADVLDTEKGGLRDGFFTAFLLVYTFEISAKIYAYGWRIYRLSRWNIYNGTVSTLALLATILRLIGLSSPYLNQVQKLLLTATLLRLVPQNEILDRLFTTMA